MSTIKSEFIEKLALFFYFCFLDEAKAQTYTVQTLKKLNQNKIQKLVQEGSSSNPSIVLVRATQAMLAKKSKNIKPTSLAFSSDYIELPPHSNWGPWFEFRKKANEEEVQAVLYAKILKLSEDDIAAGLKVPLGTVRYRIGQGLRLLGVVCAPEKGLHEFGS